MRDAYGCGLEVRMTREGLVDTSTYVELLRAQGFNVIETASCYWHDRGVRQEIGPQWVHFFVGGPPHHPVSPSSLELAEVFAKSRAFGVKYVTSRADEGKASYHFICADPSYDLQSLKKKARNQTRRGLERCKIEKIVFDFLHAAGMGLMRDSWERRGRGVTVSDAWWRRFCEAAPKFKDAEAFGASAEGQLAAFVTTVIIEGVCYIGFVYSLRALLWAHPNNALIFTITRDMLYRDGVHCVSLGLESLEGLSSLEHFKVGMGFRREPVRQHVVLNPLVRPLFNRPTVALGRKMIKKWGHTEFWRRVDGILRFCVESRSETIGRPL